MAHVSLGAALGLEVPLVTEPMLHSASFRTWMFSEQ
jgi:hypothetical protein